MGTKIMSLQEARLKKGLSYEEVAEKTGHSVRRIAWFEENPGELVADEAIELCNIYGVSLDDISFRDTGKKEFFGLYDDARRMLVVASLKSKIANILLSVTNDEMYTDKALIMDLLGLIDDVQIEEEVVTKEINELFDRKNHLNLSLAGR